MHPKIKEALTSFFGQHKEIKVKKGELLLQPVNKVDNVYCLTKGAVRMYSISRKGVETSLNIFKPTSLFPLGPVINGGKNTYYYEALEAASVFAAPKVKVVTFLKDNPKVVYDLLARIYKGLDGYFILVETLLGGSAYHRVVAQLMIQKKRFGKVGLTHSKLASLTGLSRETVTRQIKMLQKKKLVRYSGHSLVIAKPDKLEAELN